MPDPAPYRGAVHWLVRALIWSGPLRDMSARRRIAIVVFVFPVLMSAAALLYGAEAAIYVLRSQPVTGTVVQRYEWPGETIFDRGTMNYEPIFTYKMNGETHRASVGSAHASFDLEPGEAATIRAIPGARGNVRLDTWQGLWFMPLTLGWMALAAWVVAALVWGLLDRTLLRKEAT